MSYETRAYDNEHGDPVVVLVATGTHDVSRLVNLLGGGSPNSEQRRLGEQVLRQVRRHSAGRTALRLLHHHGGPDFTSDPADPEAVELAERRAAADLHALARAGERMQNQQPSGCACPPDSLKACAWNEDLGRLVEEIRHRASRSSAAATQPADEDLGVLRDPAGDHYDGTEAIRRRAVAAGAAEIDPDGLLELMRRRRDAARAASDTASDTAGETGASR